MDMSSHHSLLSISFQKTDRTKSCPQSPKHLLDDDLSAESWTGSVSSVALFSLLFAQFALLHSINELHDLNWNVVNASIFLFALVTHLYRKVLTEIGLMDDIAMIFPEICTVLCMATAYWLHPVAAFLLLLVGKLMLALAVVLIHGYQLSCPPASISTQDVSNSALEDKLDSIA